MCVGFSGNTTECIHMCTEKKGKKSGRKCTTKLKYNFLTEKHFHHAMIIGLLSTIGNVNKVNYDLRTTIGMGTK